ncbi:hypothetical protein PENTCL1PPCAC_25516, partial [Pristionchus entomophagus]
TRARASSFGYEPRPAIAHSACSREGVLLRRQYAGDDVDCGGTADERARGQEHDSFHRAHVQVSVHGTQGDEE